MAVDCGCTLRAGFRGGGAVYVATLIDPVLKEQNGDNDKVVVKEVKPLDQLTEEQNLLLVKQEVAAMA